MNTKTILIFEDEWNTIKGSFELANIYAFEDKLRFIVKAKSQDASFDDLRNEYSAIFVDITLKNSKTANATTPKSYHSSRIVFEYIRALNNIVRACRKMLKKFQLF